MTTAYSKVTSKGQITLPKQIRTKLAIYPGDRLEFSLDNSNTVVLRKKRAPGASAGCGKRFLKEPSKRVSVEEMNAAIRKVVIGKFKQANPVPQ